MNRKLLIYIAVNVFVAGCKLNPESSVDVGSNTQVGDFETDIAVAADQHLLTIGIDPCTKRKSLFRNFHQWSDKYLTFEASPYLIRIVNELRAESTSVVLYSSKEEDLGGVVIVFIDKESKRVLATYRGK
jgi:hypothetical protein